MFAFFSAHSALSCRHRNAEDSKSPGGQAKQFRKEILFPKAHVPSIQDSILLKCKFTEDIESPKLQMQRTKLPFFLDRLRVKDPSTVVYNWTAIGFTVISLPLIPEATPSDLKI